MSRMRQATSTLTGHWTQSQLADKRRAEEMVSIDYKELLKLPPELFGKSVWTGCDWPEEEQKAYKGDLRKAWKFCVSTLIERGIADNADRLNLINYCRSWADVQRLYRIGIQDIEYSRSKDYVTTLSQADANYRKYAQLCGISLDGRLKTGAKKVEQEDALIEGRFGNI